MDPLKIVAANVFDSQIGITYKTKTSHTLTTSAPVAVMLQEKEKDSYMNIVIADPARKQKTVQITLTNFKAKDFDKNFTDGSVTTTITGDTIILNVVVDKTKGAGQKVRILF